MPTDLTATSKLTAFLTLYYLILAIRVIRLRIKNKIALGDGTLQFLLGSVLPAIVKTASKSTEDASSSKTGSVESNLENRYASLQKAIRAHNNLAQYGPWTILLFPLCELQSTLPLYWLNNLAVIFAVARVLHVEAGISSSSSLGFGRSLGMSVTFATMFILAFALIYPTLAPWLKPLLQSISLKVPIFQKIFVE